MNTNCNLLLAFIASFAASAFVCWWFYRIGYEDGRKFELEREWARLKEENPALMRIGSK